ncbi:MAG: peptide ABC transporter [Candidatus Terraquivivens tikiterensis]|uniref:Peptide ABC transporter n=1 Tax=Candidatus Terraquivivens tikiterensis TaxID=1980982 RepID=A0A2R7Y267_9ARCH|nr:MAG: peptide ABC transporter [Candidatus Terraquivivens tikiterensis]
MKSRFNVLKSVYENTVFRRAVLSLLSLLGLSLIIFTLARIVPGDPARMALGPRAPEEIVQKYREMLHLNEPIYVQYYYWLTNLFQGKLGISLTSFREVSVDIAEFLPATLELMLFVAIIQIAGTLILGTLSGSKPGSILDGALRVFTYVGICVPAFVWGLILQFIFSYVVGVFPATERLSPGITVPRITGLVTVDALATGNFRAFVDALWHLILPSLALALGAMAQEARILRSAMVENINKDYVLTLLSHGIPGYRIYFKYALKPSVASTIPVIGLDIASLIANAFMVEVIFNWPGISKFGITAMLKKDLNGIVGVVLMAGLIYTVTNVIVDLILTIIDPRLRYGEK